MMINPSQMLLGMGTEPAPAPSAQVDPENPEFTAILADWIQEADRPELPLNAVPAPKAPRQEDGPAKGDFAPEQLIAMAIAFPVPAPAPAPVAAAPDAKTEPVAVTQVEDRPATDHPPVVPLARPSTKLEAVSVASDRGAALMAAVLEAMNREAPAPAAPSAEPAMPAPPSVGERIADAMDPAAPPQVSSQGNPPAVEGSAPRPKAIREALGQIIQRIRERVEVHWSPRVKPSAGAPAATSAPMEAPAPESAPIATAPKVTPAPEVRPDPIIEGFSATRPAPTPRSAQTPPPFHRPAEPRTEGTTLSDQSAPLSAWEEPATPPEPAAPRVATGRMQDVQPRPSFEAKPGVVPRTQAQDAEPQVIASPTPEPRARRTAPADSTPGAPPLPRSQSAEPVDAVATPAPRPSVAEGREPVPAPIRWPEPAVAARPEPSAIRLIDGPIVIEAPARMPAAAAPVPETVPVAKAPAQSEGQLPPVNAREVRAARQPVPPRPVSTAPTDARPSASMLSEARPVQAPVAAATTPKTEPLPSEIDTAAPRQADRPTPPPTVAEEPVQIAKAEPATLSEPAQPAPVPRQDANRPVEVPVRAAQPEPARPVVEMTPPRSPIQEPQEASLGESASVRSRPVQSAPAPQTKASEPIETAEAEPRVPLAIRQEMPQRQSEPTPAPSHTASMPVEPRAETPAPAQAITSTLQEEPVSTSARAAGPNNAAPVESAPVPAETAPVADSESKSAGKPIAKEAAPVTPAKLKAPAPEPMLAEPDADPAPRPVARNAKPAAAVVEEPVPKVAGPKNEPAKAPDNDQPVAPAQPAPASRAQHVERIASPPVREAPESMPRHFVDQVVRAIRVDLSEGRSEMHMRLDPPDLGQLQVRLVSEGGAVTARFHAETETVRALLESQLPALREALSEAGIKVQQFNVYAGTDFSRFSHQPSGQERSLPRRRSDARSAEPVAPVEMASQATPSTRPAGAVDYLA